MSDYTNTFGGAAKDSGQDVILGAAHDTQYDAVATMSATKANKITSPDTDNLLVMDGSGDLKDSTQTVAELTLAIQETLNPVGTIFQSTSSTNPGTSKGFGTWTQIAEGRTLIGEGTGSGLTARTAAATGGAEDAVTVAHTHTMASAGAHTHNVGDNSTVEAAGGGTKKPGNSNTPSSSAGAHTHTITSSGVAGTDLNMPPYLVVYIWERTA